MYFRWFWGRHLIVASNIQLNHCCYFLIAKLIFRPKKPAFFNFVNVVEVHNFRLLVLFWSFVQLPSAKLRKGL